MSAEKVIGFVLLCAMLALFSACAKTAAGSIPPAAAKRKVSGSEASGQEPEAPAVGKGGARAG